MSSIIRAGFPQLYGSPAGSTFRRAAGPGIGLPFSGGPTTATGAADILVSEDELYSKHAATIEAVIAVVCRRHRLTPDRADELGSLFRLKLVEHDFAVLRQFQGRSSIRTYLVTVCERVLLDWRISEWGKWRPCMEARRLGDLAIELDRLLTRDRLTFEEAVETLLTSGRAQSRAEIEDIRPRLAQRRGHRLVDDDALKDLPAPGGSADRPVLDEERRRRLEKVVAALTAALYGLPPQDQVILRLRFQNGFTVAQIALDLGFEQKPLYRRFERLFRVLREALEQAGVRAEDVRDLFGSDASLWAAILFRRREGEL